MENYSKVSLGAGESGTGSHICESKGSLDLKGDMKSVRKLDCEPTMNQI